MPEDLASQNLCSLPRRRASDQGKELQRIQQQVPQWKAVQRTPHHADVYLPRFQAGAGLREPGGRDRGTQGHHPDILLAWGKAEITLWTHKINGLTQSDFIMAAKIDQLLDRRLVKRSVSFKISWVLIGGITVCTALCQAALPDRIPHAHSSAGTIMISPGCRGHRSQPTLHGRERVHRHRRR